MTIGYPLSVFALGGVHEIGKNMYVIEYGEDIVIIDCGGKFPGESLLGVDLIIPDVTYLLESKDRIRALLVTHGHEDHIGGIPYLLKQLQIPVYATRFTLGLIELKLKEHKLLRESELIEITSESTIQFQHIAVEFFKINHSIPDCLGIALKTPEGTIVHTGDFKFDLTPENHEVADIHKIAQLGSEGVLLLISESTNAERPGSSPSEKVVGYHIEEAFQKATQKIIITTFASNVNRIQQIIHAAIKTNRKVALLGRSMVNVVSVALERGYLTVPNDIFIDARAIKQLPPEEVVILCTGSQGEQLAAMSKLATNNHRDAQVLPGDTIIFAAGPIPGNERNVTRLVDYLYALGANVIYGSGNVTGMHVSGHAYQDELTWMLSLIKPTYFIPIHGEYRMLHHHQLLAQAVGIQANNCFLLRNGDVVDIQQGKARQTREVTAGNVYVDNSGVEDVADFILRDRKQLSEEGMLVIVLSIHKAECKLIAGPDIVTRGFVHKLDTDLFVKDIQLLISTMINDLQDANSFHHSSLKRRIRKVVGQYVHTHTRRKPMILPFIIEI